MNKIKFISRLFVVAMLYLPSVNAQNNSKPNIVYIMADDMGIGDVSGLNPNSKIQTPNIDKLIEQGMNFTDAHTASSVCTPTRYGLLTGRYPWRTQLKARVLDGYSKPLITDKVDTAPALLKRHGYQTAAFGKWHLGWDWAIEDADKLEMNEATPAYKYAKGVDKKVDFTKPFTNGPTDRGFDHFYGINTSMSGAPYTMIIDDRVSVIPTDIYKKSELEKKKYTGAEAKQRGRRAGLMAPGFDAEAVMQKLTEKAVSYIKNADEDKPMFLYFPLIAPHTPVVPRKEFVGTSKAALYGDFIQELDWTVGEIVKALKEKGIEDNTIIIFTADNGASRISFSKSFEEKYDHKPSRELKGRKGSLDEGGHRVPFVVKWGNTIKKKSDNNTTISLNDLYATCAEIVGEKVKDQGVDSYSILSELEGEKGGYTRESLVQVDFGGRFAIRKGDYKLTFDMEKSKKLFNLKEDISETNDLFKDPKYNELKEELTKELTEVISNGRSTKGKKLENEGPKTWKQISWMK